MVLTEPALPTVQLLGLDSKMYPRNMQPMLNNDSFLLEKGPSSYVVHIGHILE